MDFPYYSEFQTYCKITKHYAHSTMLVVNKSIATFWQYETGDYSKELDQITSSDIQTFLNSLEEKLNLKQSTINKYISHIKLYFTFLYSHNLISHYPMLEINGRQFNRKKVYLINWMKYLPEICQLPKLHFETVMMMLVTALGYLPEQALKVRYFDLAKQVKNPVLKQYLKENLDFKNEDNPYVLGKKFGGAYSSDFHLAQKVKADREIIGMDLTLQSLRLSYVYSILSQKNLNDEQLMEKLQVNSKSLFYYRQNMNNYNELIEFDLDKVKSRLKS